jgi:D-arabinose 1-dehydrogenase-like Zn-dependent alcohol dehydrogenase
MIGVLADPTGDLRLPIVVMQQLRLQGITVGSLEDFRMMVDAVALHRLQPVIDKVFSFEQAREAFAYMASRQHFGKVAIAFGT